MGIKKIFFSKNKKPGRIQTQRNRGNIFSSIKNIDFKKYFINFLILFISVAVLILGFFFVTSYQTDRYKVNELKYLSKENLNSILAENMNQPLIAIDTKKIEKQVREKSIFVDDVQVSKSLIEGAIIQIKEHSPLIVVLAPENKKYLITQDFDRIEVINDQDIIGLKSITLTTQDIDSPLLDENIQKVLKLKERLDSDLTGNYNFDNFGNLSILMEENKVIRFDLSERFFTIDEQASLLQDTLAKNRTFSEIDLRFSYLLIK